MKQCAAMTNTTFTLADLAKGMTATIAGFSTPDPALEARLREIGFSEDDEVELLNRGPINGTPLSVRLHRTIIALRTEEAKAIHLMNKG